MQIHPKPELPQLKRELKLLLAETVEHTEAIQLIDDESPLFGAESPLNMDSLDALQLSMAIQKKYGLRMADSKETRRALSSISNLANHLLARMA